MVTGFYFVTDAEKTNVNVLVIILPIVILVILVLSAVAGNVCEHKGISIY